MQKRTKKKKKPLIQLLRDNHSLYHGIQYFMHEYILYMHTHMCMHIYNKCLFMEMHIYAMCNYFQKKGVIPCLRARTLEPGCEGVCSVAQSCLTPWDPMNCGPPGSSVHHAQALQARILERVAMPSSRGIFLTEGVNLWFLCLLHGGQVLYCWSQAAEVLILTLLCAAWVILMVTFLCLSSFICKQPNWLMKNSVSLLPEFEVFE